MPDSVSDDHPGDRPDDQPGDRSDGPPPPSADEIYALTTANRLMIADLLQGLTPQQWDAPTLCEGWTVRHLAAHFSQPMLVGFVRFFVTAVRHRGDTAATVDDLTRRIARRSPEQLVTLLREHAGDRVDPPRVGPMGPFTDTCIHLRDIARPLGLTADVPLKQWSIVLDYLASGSTAEAFVPRGRLDGLAIVAIDLGRRFGEGAELSGAAEALALAVTGREVALADLAGPGVPVLRDRLPS